jgi:hypothetical protein
MVPTLIKRTPSCPTTSSSYTMQGGSATVPPSVTCPTGAGGHTL